MPNNIAFFADLHLHLWREFAHPTGGGSNSRLDAQVAALLAMRSLFSQYRIGTVVLLGDLIQTRRTVDVVVLSALVGVLREWRRSGVGRIVALVGNHDQALKDPGIHALDPLRGEFDAVVDKPKLYPMDSLFNGWCAWALPHDRPERIKAALKEMAKKADKYGVNHADPDRSLLLMHAPLRGASVGAGRRMDAGLDVSDLPMRRVRYAVLGDVHIGQRIGTSHAHYAGSPYHLNFGERDNDPSILVLSQSRKLTRVSVGEYSPRFVVTSNQSKVNRNDYFRLELGTDAPVAASVEKMPNVRIVREAKVLERAPSPEAGRDPVDAYVGDNPKRRRLVKAGKELLVEVGA